MILFGIFSIASFTINALAQEPSKIGRTLQECFEAAVHRSEVIATQSELINQAEEKYQQARAAIFPTINGVASYLVQQAPPGGTATSIAPGEQTTVKLTGTQPIFHGMREYAAILQQNLQVTAQMSAKRQAAAVLYNDVASNFYNILQLEQDIRDLHTEISVDKQRVSDLNARIRIGRSRPSEVLTVLAQIDTLAAQIEQDRGQLLASREVFAFLTGFDRDTSIQETETIHLSKEPLQNYLSHVEERPDVKAARDSLDAIEKNLTIARGGHFPQIDLTGNYYFMRPGIASQQHWDMQITGTLPIFAGGAVNSQVRFAASEARAGELNLMRTRRLGDQEIRSDYDSFSADLARVASLERASQSNMENYKAQVKDYRLGLVTNLDVLQATTASQESIRALDRARFQAKLDYIKLQTATAQRPKGETY